MSSSNSSVVTGHFTCNPCLHIRALRCAANHGEYRAVGHRRFQLFYHRQRLAEHNHIDSSDTITYITDDRQLPVIEEARRRAIPQILGRYAQRG